MHIGLEYLRDHPKLADGWGRCGLMANQASVTREFQSSWEIAHNLLGNRLTALFGPQHGFTSTVQDNMIETAHGTHGPTGLPVYSLYSECREPTEAMLKNVDTMIIDIQIVGCRIYTFKYTISGILRAARKLAKKVVVLDRPNPLGGSFLEGRILERDCHSFVGEFPIPMRHGLTPGECAQYFNRSIGADLSVITMTGWAPEKQWSALSRHWVLTSPNLPTIDPVYVFPGMVAFEGTNVSEGRGTGLPFQFIGAPFVKQPEKLVARIKDYVSVDGIIFLRPTEFQPTSQKWAGQACGGIHIHVLDHRRVASYGLACALMRSFLDLYPKDFKWREPGYEYNFTDAPIDLIMGSKSVRSKIESAKFDLKDSYWNDGVEGYRKDVEQGLLYPRSMELIEI